MRWLDVIRGKQTGLTAGIVRIGLYLASLPYGLAIFVRNRGYDRGWFRVVRPPVPVISIGNLTVGGTGKTPTVLMLAQWFRHHRLRVAILSRGYGAGADGRNDEARELETKLEDVPHLQNPDRIASAQIAVDELDMQILLLDDGFQHRRLARDLDIVLLDATAPFGYEHLLPRGLLRESPRALRRAQLVIVTRCDLVSKQSLADIRSQVQRYAPKVGWVEAEHRPVRLRNASGQEASLEAIQQQPCFAFCAIGNGEAFFATLQRCGAELVAHEVFPDHHPYTAHDLDRLTQIIERHPEIKQVLCTGKDLAKLEIDELGGKPLWMLDIELAIRFGKETFEEHMLRIADLCRDTSDPPQAE